MSASLMSEDIATWLDRLGLGQFAPAFAENGVELQHLPHLSDDDLRDLGLPLGPRRHLQAALRMRAPDQDATLRTEETDARLVAAERRQLTVLFCDLVGSTELSRKIDPEDLRELMVRYQDAVGSAVARYGGHVARFLGDGVMAYFGWPRAYEDQAERAVHAGLEAVAAVAGVRIADSTALAARVGIATGEVVVGDLVGEIGRDVAAVSGATPNLAARLQSVAEPGKVVISPVTYRLVGKIFEVEDLGRHDFKGFDDAMPVWGIVGENRSESRFEAAHGASLTPLVGRDEELFLLGERWRMAEGGKGQAVFISGEAGIGKSRLVQGLQDWAAAKDYILVRYQCSPYHANSALYPAIHQLEREAGITSDEDREDKLDKLESLLRQTGHDAEADAPLFANLLSLPYEARYGETDQSPQRIKEQILAALVNRLRRLAERTPVMFVCEDAHWIDPTSTEMLELAVGQLRRSRVLIIVTHRLEWRPPFGDTRDVVFLQLDHLDKGQGARMVRAITGDYVSSDFVERIVSRTDGIPLFIEELTKSLVEGGFGISEPEIPSTLQASLLARLDRLGPDAREVRQIGAVIGREFSHDLLASVSDKSLGVLDTAVDRLIQSELIYRTGTAANAIYVFKHSLIQDGAYYSLLRARRQSLHGSVAYALERDAAVVEAEPELLAYHFTEAGLQARAAEHWQQAGQRAMTRFATQEAATLFSKALDTAPLWDYQEILLQADLGAEKMESKGFDYAATAEALLNAHQSGEGGGDPLLLGRSMKALVWFKFRQTNLDLARDVARRLVDLAECHQDKGLHAAAYNSAGAMALFSGELSHARDYFERAITHYDPGDHLALADQYGMDPGINCLSLGAITYWLLGFPDLASKWLTDSLARNDNVTHPFTVSVTWDWAAITFSMLGDDRATERWAEATISYATEHDFVLSIAQGTMMSGWAMAKQGRAEGLDKMDRGLEQKNDAGSRTLIPYLLGRLAEARAAHGQFGSALDVLDEAIAAGRDTGEQWWEPELHRLRGDVLAKAGDTTGEAERCLEHAFEAAERMGALSLQLRVATSLYRLCRTTGKEAVAREMLDTVYGRFSEGFGTADLMEARELLLCNP